MATALIKEEFLVCEKINYLFKKVGIPSIVKYRKGLEICIRECREDDMAALVSLYRGFEPKGIAMGLPPIDSEVRIKWLRCLLGSFFNILALDRKKVIGHAAISLTIPMVFPEYLIFLHQDYRRRGIGTHLTLIAKRICQELDCKGLWVTVSTHNIRAIRFFNKLGFQFKGPMDADREMVCYLQPGPKESISFISGSTPESAKPVLSKM